MKRVVYLGLILIALIVMVLFSSNIFSQLNQHHIDMQISNDKAVTYRLKEHIVEKFYKAQLDTIFVASFLGDHLNSSNDVSSDKIEKVKTELSSVVPSLFKVNSIFSNMSYIDMIGRELITMDANGYAGKPFLKTLTKDECFRKTYTRKTGEVYTTFDNNAIYICSPVFDETDKLSGVIVMVVDKAEMLKELLPLLSKGDVILMEDTGNYILSSAGHYGKRNFLDEYSDSLFHKILTLQSGNIVSNKKTLLTYTPVDLDDRQWFLLLSTDKESVIAQFSALYEQLVIVLALAVLAIIAAIVLWFGFKRKEQVTKQEKSQKEILQTILDSLGAGIFMTDNSGKIIFINKAWKEIFNYLDDDICGNSGLFIQSMMAGMENNQEILTKLLGLVGDGEISYAVDLEQTSPVNRFINLYSNPCISHTNHGFGRVFVVRDISHQKEVDRLKLELISTVSHELRTPMSSILGFSELLLTRKLSEERNKEYIGIINSEARRLTDLINDFLDIQRMESGKLIFNKQFNSIDQIIDEAIKPFENYDDKHIIIYGKSTENIGLVNCDREKILQVLSNLLSNAIKYSPDGGEVKVDLSVANGKVRVNISDHGLGIPNEVMDKLFTKFFRVNNDDRRKIGGSGLGLAICKEIVRAHGGEIGVESTYGYGSTFYFELPYSDNITGGESKGKVNGNSTKCKGNLLIVEDDSSIVRLIKEVLKDEGLEMHDVSSGEEALKFADRYHYKLIILDIALSGRMSGWDVLKELKGNQSTADTPIIISSVYENRNMAFQSGITDYLVKPFEPEQLIRMVQKAYNGKLNSKMMVNSDNGLNEVILEMLNSRKIGVKQIEHSGNILIITLDGEEGLEND